MNKKIIKYLSLILIGLSLVGCASDNTEEETVVDDDYVYNTGFPESEIVENIPEILDKEDIIYYEYENSITIYVSDVDTEYATNYISKLSDYGWVNENDDEDSLHFSGYNEDNQYLYVDYDSLELTIMISE